MLSAPQWLWIHFPRWRSLTPFQAVIGSLIVAALVRLWCLSGIPLTIANDGVWYLKWAGQIVDGSHIDWPVVRTPGYPLFIAALFWLFGKGPMVVLVAQHVVGSLAVPLMAGIASRLASPRWGLLLGVIVALDPVLLATECYALTEATSVAGLIASVAIVLLAHRRTWPMAALLGLSLGWLCLVRPAFQIVVPFLALAWICVPRNGWRWRCISIAAIGLGFLACTGPWLIHNWKLGIRGLSSSNAVLLWIGVNQAELLTEGFPLPEPLRAEYDRLVRPDPTNDHNNLLFINTLQVWDRPDIREHLANWAAHSIRTHPLKYGRAVVVAFGWQIEIFSQHARIAHDDTRWLVWRLGEDGRTTGNLYANFNATGEPREMDAFAMPASRGAFRRYFRWWGRCWWLGIPRVVLFASAVVATLIAVRRRNWPLILVLLSTFSFTASHVFFLLCQSRYSMPCWILWWIAPVLCMSAARHWWLSRRGAGVDTRVTS